MLAVTGTDIYYALNLTDLNVPGSSVMTGSVRRVPIRGGPSEFVAQVVGGGPLVPQGFAVTSTRVVFGEVGGVVASSGGAIVTVPLAGGPTTVVASLHGTPGAVVADDENIYFVDGEGTKRVPLAGGKVSMIATAMPLSIAIVGAELILADYYAGSVFSVPKVGGPLKVLATQQKPIFPLGCGRNVCWMNQGGEVGSNASLIELAPGGSPVTIAGDPDLFEPHGLAFDGTSFFATGGSPIGTLVKISAAGHSIAPVASMAGLSSVVVDDSCIYWSSFDGIFSLAK